MDKSLIEIKKEVQVSAKVRRATVKDLLRQADQDIAKFTGIRQINKETEMDEDAAETELTLPYVSIKANTKKPRLWSYVTPLTKQKLERWSLESGLHIGLLIDIMVARLGNNPLFYLIQQSPEGEIGEMGVGCIKGNKINDRYSSNPQEDEFTRCKETSTCYTSW